MEPSRKSAVAALVFALVAVPGIAVAAVAARDAPGDDARPGSSKHADREPRDKGRDRAEKSSAAGRAHAEAMKKWARCVADAASGPKSEDRARPPKEACGDKPVGPGRAKHQEDGSAAGRGDKRGHPHGKMKQKHR